MFVLSDVDREVHGVVPMDGARRIILPIAHVGRLLDWHLRRVYLDEALAFDRPVIMLFAHAGDLRVPVVVPDDVPIDAVYAWHAEPQVLWVWRQ